jgi:hypothetical protein
MLEHEISLNRVVRKTIHSCPDGIFIHGNLEDSEETPGEAVSFGTAGNEKRVLSIPSSSSEEYRSCGAKEVDSDVASCTRLQTLVLCWPGSKRQRQ